jgi:hypothetical protein
MEVTKCNFNTLRHDFFDWEMSCRKKGLVIGPVNEVLINLFLDLHNIKLNDDELTRLYNTIITF